MSQELTRTARIEARIAPEVLAVVKRAAEIQGRSGSDFVVSAAQEAAEASCRWPRYPTIPAALMGRLAVDQQFRGRGLGAALIVDAIARAMRAEPAIFALVVDAKDDTALRFYQHLGFQRFVSHPMR